MTNNANNSLFVYPRVQNYQNISSDCQSYDVKGRRLRFIHTVYTFIVEITS